MLPLTITVPQPCSANWQQMTPAAQGRHCAACAKVVIDFTQQTDAELLAWFRQAGAVATCGRFRPDQLNRPLQPAPRPRWQRWLAALVAVWGLRTATVAAQQPLLPLAPRPVRVATKWAELPASAGWSTGMVVDSRTLLPLPGVTVQLIGTDQQTVTDSTGRFKLAVPTAPESAKMMVLLAGYLPQTLPLSAATRLPVVMFRQLDTDAGLTGILGGAVPGLSIQSMPLPFPMLRLEDWLR